MTADRLSRQLRTAGQGTAFGEASDRLRQPRAADSEFQPLELALDLIDEDPDQPRTEDNPGFSVDSLEDLAATIGRRGIKTPISVREHPDKPGRFIVNHGARRLRASKLADKTTIPAFIDNNYNEADQVIENLQRNELTAREIADFIGRELARGATRKEIAVTIGKSPAFISQHVTLLELPEPVAEAYNGGRVRDVTVINELVTAYKKSPDAVVAWLSDEGQELTRGAVKLLREFLDDRSKRAGEDDEGDDCLGYDPAEMTAPGGRLAAYTGRRVNPSRLRKTIIQVRHDGRPARLLLNRRPPAEGWAWLKYEDDGQEFAADLTQVQLVALMEG